MSLLLTWVDKYYSHVSHLWNIYVNHSENILIVNISIVLLTLAYMSIVYGYTGESPVGPGGDGPEYIIIPLIETVLTWISVAAFTIFLYVLPVLLVGFFPYLAGIAGRRFKNWINKPEPSPFLGQKLEATEFEVKNDWKDYNIGDVPPRSK